VTELALQTVVAVIDERTADDELDRAWAVLSRLWNAVDHSIPPKHSRQRSRSGLKIGGAIA
jgi:hypothetical protein